MSKYPEHDKLRAIKDKSQAIGEFLQWLRLERVPRIILCEIHPHDGDYFPSMISMQRLLAEYFEIDPDKLEDEKLKMLEECRAVHGQ
jgi:hypothetical protein